MSDITLSAEVEAALTRIENCSETLDCADGCCTHIEDRHTEDAATLRTALERAARIEAAAQELEASQESVNGANDETYRRLSAAKNALRAALNDREDG
jgi:hypothetical protein